MARSIDYTNLSAEDLRYLSDRQWLIAEGDYQGFETSAAVAAWREDGTVPDQGEIEGEEDGIAYGEATKAQLQEELKSRGLEVSGTKDELIARLEADDEEEDEEDEIPES